MGIDHYNCDVCGRIFPDCDDYGVCNGCEATWCEYCTSRVECFYYGGQDRCSLCYSDEAMGIPDDMVLAYVLRQLGKTQDEVEQEMTQLPAYDGWTKPRASYTCQDKTAHVCDPRCSTLGDDWDVQVAPPESDLEVVRGLCCRAKWPAADDAGEWCHACQCTGEDEEAESLLKKSKSE
jgi:hypothetical protein